MQLRPPASGDASQRGCALSAAGRGPGRPRPSHGLERVDSTGAPTGNARGPSVLYTWSHL